MNHRLNNLLSNTFFFTLANLGSKLMAFFMVPLYTAVLTPEEYGISDLLNTTVGLIFPILTLCIVESVLRYCFLKEYNPKDIFAVGHRVIIYGTLVSCLFSAMCYYIPLFEEMKVFLFFIPLQFVSTAYNRLLVNYARGIGLVKESAWSGLICTAVIVILNLFFLLVLKIGVWGYISSMILAYVVSSLYLSYKITIPNLNKGRYSKALAKEMCSFSMPLIPNQLNWWLLDSFSRFLIKAFVGISSVGLFSAAMKIPTILTVLAGIFESAWLLSALDDYGSEESKRFIKTIHENYFSLLVVLTSILILLAEPLAKILLSNEFYNQWHIIPVLFISVFFGALAGFIGTIFSAEKVTIKYFTTTIIGGIISVIISVVFLRDYGILASAVSIAVGYLIIWIFRRLEVRKYLDIGVGRFKSIVIIALLFVEAFLISKELWYWGVVSFVSVNLIIYNDLKYIILYAVSTMKQMIKKK